MGRRAEWRLIALRFPLRFGRRALPCLPHCGALGSPSNPVARARPRVRVGLAAGATAWRAFRPSELFDGRSALLFLSVSAVPSFGTFPQLGESFPQIPEKLLTNVRGGDILLSHPNRKVYPPNVRPRAPANAVAASLFVGTAENPVKLQRLAGFFFACGGAVTFAQASSKPP